MNIRLFACTLLSACVFASCHSDKTMEDIETVSYTFQVINPITGSLDDFDTRAGEASTPLYLCVYDVVEGEAPKRVEYREKCSNILAPITLDLTPGAHRICFLSSTTSWASTINNDNTLQLTWSSVNEPLDQVWSYALDIDAQSDDANKNRKIILNRVVAYVGIKIKDALPKYESTIHHELDGGTWIFDMLNQTGGMANKISLDTKVPKGDYGKQNKEFGMYTFVPEGVETAFSYTITAYHEYDTIQSYTISNVPLAPNQYTIYEGEFFNPQNRNQVSMELERDWNTVRYDFEGNRLND